MHMRHLIPLCTFSFGCSEYDIKSNKDAGLVQDTGMPGLGTVDPTDTGEPLDEDEPTDAEAPTDDEPPVEPPEEDTAEPCSEVVTAFDIEELSTLQDAASPYLVTDPRLGTFAEPWYRDALALSYSIPLGEPETSWRVSAVEVLVMIATNRFSTHPDGGPLWVEVFDGRDPRIAPGWTSSQNVYKAEHTWTAYTLPYDAAISGPLGEYNQQGTWVRFDLTDVIPETGMTSSDFVVGVKWEELSQVAVGYSNFNRACDRNWTEWDPGSGWILNGDTSSGYHCSWPMMRVEIERVYTDDCE